MTLREIIENSERWGEFLRTVSKVSDSNKEASGKQHSNQENWNKLIDDYEEYLKDVEFAIRNANGREGHRRSLLVRNMARFTSGTISDDELKELRQMRYKDFEIDAIRKYVLLRKFFELESKRIKDGKAVVNGRIKRLLKKYEALETYLLSVSTEGEENVKNNRKLPQKRKQRGSK